MFKRWLNFLLLDRDLYADKSGRKKKNHRIPDEHLKNHAWLQNEALVDLAHVPAVVMFIYNLAPLGPQWQELAYWADLLFITGFYLPRIYHRAGLGLEPAVCFGLFHLSLMVASKHLLVDRLLPVLPPSYRRTLTVALLIPALVLRLVEYYM